MMNENTTRESAVCAMKEGNAFLDSRDDEHALESVSRASELYCQLGDRKRQADALNLTAGILVRLDRADEAITALSGVIDLLGEEPLSRMRGMALSNRGLILARQKQYQDALGCFGEALALYQKGDEPIRVAEQWGNIGTVYRELEQPDHAIKNYQKALAIYREIDNRERIGDQYTNIAYAHMMKQTFKNALRWYRESLSYYTIAGCEEKAHSTQANIDRIEIQVGIIRPCNC